VKIVHTSDWHVGRRWKGISREAEMAAVLDHLAGYIERHAIDLVLHTGDVFDSRNPPAEAEQLVNRFFVRVGRAGARMIVIAGNHDDPLRLDARSQLTELASVEILGRPRAAAHGGARLVETRSGERAIVSALPFASTGAWVSALELAGDEAAARSRYARMFQLAIQNLCAGHRTDTVNILMAHTHLDGALLGDSERRVHIGEEWAAAAQTLPATASYIALGHIHRPQKIAGTLPAYYAGSPLQMDFGEAGQEKTFVVVTAAPGKPAAVEHVPYEGGLPLADLRASLAELEADAATHRGRGWLRVTVPLGKPDPDVSRKVRALLPNALVVHAELPDAEAPARLRLDAGASPVARFGAFHAREHGREADAAALEAFGELYAEAAAEEA
jgi:exonuclease SbcD